MPLGIPTNNRGVNHDNVLSEDCSCVVSLGIPTNNRGVNHDNVLSEDCSCVVSLGIPTNNRGVNHEDVLSEDCLRVNQEGILSEDLCLLTSLIIKERPGELEGVFHFLDAEAQTGVGAEDDGHPAALVGVGFAGYGRTPTVLALKGTGKHLVGCRAGGHTEQLRRRRAVFAKDCATLFGICRVEVYFVVINGVEQFVLAMFLCQRREGVGHALVDLRKQGRMGRVGYAATDSADGSANMLADALDFNQFRPQPEMVVERLGKGIGTALVAQSLAHSGEVDLGVGLDGIAHDGYAVEPEGVDELAAAFGRKPRGFIVQEAVDLDKRLVKSLRVGKICRA